MSSVNPQPNTLIGAVALSGATGPIPQVIDREVASAIYLTRGVCMDPAEWVAHLLVVENGMIERDYVRFPFTVVDLFAGAGGSSNGILHALEQLRVPVLLIQINHWTTAIQTQILNFPNAVHYNASVETPDPKDVVPWHHVDLLVASPECITFSPARGKNKRIREQSRSSAAYILTWLENVIVERFAIENVKEWKTQWGRMNKAETRTLRGYEGEYFRAFVKRLKQLGYGDVVDAVLNAADFGSYTCRHRLFLVGSLERKGRQRARHPQPTHAQYPKHGLKPWNTARKIIDFLDLGESSFARYERKVKKSGAVVERAVGPHAVNSLKRTRAGYHRQITDRPGAMAYVVAFDALLPIARDFADATPPTDKSLENAKLARANYWRTRFGFPERKETLANRKAERTRILLASAVEWRDRYALVGTGLLTSKERRTITDVNVQRSRAGTEETFREPIIDFTLEELRIRDDIAQAMIVPDRTHGTAETVDAGPAKVITSATGGGNFLTQPTIQGQQSNATAKSVDDANVPTVAAAGRIALANPTIFGQHSRSVTREVDDGPIMTTTGDGAIALNQPALADASLIRANAGEHTVFNDVARSVDRPMGTIGTTESLALATPQLSCVAHGENDDRKIQVDRPLPCAHSKRNVSLNTPLAEPALIEVAHAFDDERERRSAEIDAPFGSFHTGGKYGVSSAAMNLADAGLTAEYSGFERGENAAPVSLDKPTPSVTADGNHLSVYQPAISDLAEPGMTAQYSGFKAGAAVAPRSLDKPAPPLTTCNHLSMYQPAIAEAMVVSRNSMHQDDENRSRRVDEGPLFTSTGDGGGYLATPQIVPQHGGAATQDTDRPIPTAVAIARIGLVQERSAPFDGEAAPDAFIYEPHGERETQAERVHSLDKPALTVTPRGGGTLVTNGPAIRDVQYKPKIRIDGRVYVIDSFFRMLRNRELAKAMSLIDEERGYEMRFAGSQQAVTKQIGNAVDSKVMEEITLVLCSDVHGVPHDVPIVDILLAPLPMPTENDRYGIYRERMIRAERRTNAQPRPTWFDPKENATHLGIHEPGGAVTYIELARNDDARAASHPYEIQVVAQSDEPTSLELFEVAA